MAFKKVLIILLVSLVHVGLCELIDLMCKEVREIVDGHNSRRLQVAEGSISGQPAAANMKYIAWDFELAEKAVSWASRGEFFHNPDRNIDSDRFIAGENIYYYSTTASNYDFSVDQALSAWFDENKDFIYAALADEDFERPSETQIGHYTQMIWANTTYVGCGLSKKEEYGWTTFILVCNYGPAGNIIGEIPYEAQDSEGENNVELICGNEDGCVNIYGEFC